ncbi:MAG TPA: hypothetical protein VL463_21095 [Kofleriaceae bacterium]|nr:hypothetical protein [Kofleriaceae bacterium]
MKRILLPVMIALASIGYATDAHADHKRQVRYVGIHPIPKEYGGGTCYIEVPHVHVYMVPDAKVHYRDHRGSLYFVGDPVAYGYDGPKYAYNGPHPIRVDAVVGDDDEDEEYCYITGPHYHAYAPPEVISADFQLQGGAYWWVGTPPQAYVDARPVYAKVNAYYTPMHYERPVVVVDSPPPGWIGASIEVVPPVAAVEVHTPGVIVEEAPPPPVVVNGGVGFEAHVGVALPSLDVHVGGPSAVIVGSPPPDRVIIVDKHHHDNGRHRGWYKHH